MRAATLSDQNSFFIHLQLHPKHFACRLHLCLYPQFPFSFDLQTINIETKKKHFTEVCVDEGRGA